MPFVYSKLTADQRYTGFKKGGGDLPVAEKEVFIKGGSGLADPNTGYANYAAVMTEVSKEDLEFLKTNVVFNRHVEKGFILISDTKADGENAATDMADRDSSSQLRPEDYTSQGQKAPTHSGTGKRK